MFERTLILIVVKGRMKEHKGVRVLPLKLCRYLAFLSAFESLHPHTSPKIYRLFLSHLK